MQIILKIKNMFKKMRNKIIYLKNENRRESNLQNLPFTPSGPQHKGRQNYRRGGYGRFSCIHWMCKMKSGPFILIIFI